MRRYLQSQDGMTLMEIIIAMAISTMIGLFVIYFARDITDSSLRVNNSVLTQQQMQQTLQLMMPEIRSASQSENGGYPIAQAATTTFTFYADVDQDGDFDRIRYFLNGTEFTKGVVNPTGNPLTYVTSTEVFQPLVSNMVLGTQIFTYFGSTATSSQSPPLPFPINVLQIKTVEVSLVANQGTTSTPAFVGVKNQATIRNLRFD